MTEPKSQFILWELLENIVQQVTITTLFPIKLNTLIALKKRFNPFEAMQVKLMRFEDHFWQHEANISENNKPPAERNQSGKTSAQKHLESTLTPSYSEQVPFITFSWFSFLVKLQQVVKSDLSLEKT